MSKLGDLAVIVAGVSEHRLEYYQYNVPNNAAPDAIAPATQAQIAAASTSDDSLDVLTVADIFMGGGVAIDPNTIAITDNPDQTTSASVTSTDGTRSGIASYGMYGNLQGGATVGPQWDQLFGVLPDFSKSNKQILVDANSTVTVTGSGNMLYVGAPTATTSVFNTSVTLDGDNDVITPNQATANAEYVKNFVTVNGNNDNVTTDMYDVVNVSGSNDTVTGGNVTGIFSSAAMAPVGALGDATVFTAGGTFTGSNSLNNYTDVNILEGDGSKIETTSAYASSGPALFLLGTNGIIYERASGFVNNPYGEVSTYNADGSEAASETFNINADNSIGPLIEVDFYTLTDNWSTASLKFIPGTQTVANESIYGSSGSIRYNADSNDGTFYEDFTIPKMT